MLLMNRMDGRCILLFFAILFASPGFARQPSTSTGTSEAVWTWSKQCGDNHELGVTVRLQRKVLYRGILPICHGSREAEDGRVEFHFSGGHRFQGEYRTRPTDSIEGDIWQAGGESDALILGVSFDSTRQILLNTLHVARPDKPTSSR